MSFFGRSLIASWIATTFAAGGSLHTAVAQGKTGTIRGHVRLTGKLPGNPVIRMSIDPMCSKLNAGKQVVDERVAAALDGSLANVFVSIQGTFPQTPVPAQPVVIDQRACIYYSRVAGIRVGQTLQIRNSDSLLHNVHGSSSRNPSFNVSQPKAGVVYEYRPKTEEIMLKLGCDVHRWMTAYVGIVNHPYFAVSGTGGVFSIADVPAGTHTIQAWHEVYGLMTQKVTIKPGAIAVVEFTYAAK